MQSLLNSAIFYGIKAAIENLQNEHDYVPIKAYLQKQRADQIWPTGHNLPTHSSVQNTSQCLVYQRHSKMVAVINPLYIFSISSIHQ